MTMLALNIREKNGEERQLMFDKEEVTIGRASGSDIVLPRNNISKRHARLVDKHDKVVIVDLRSTNGTYVNGRRITAPELLTQDDKVYIGDFVIRLSRASEGPRATAPFAATPDPRTAKAPTVAATPGPPPAMANDDALTQAIAAVEEAEAVPAPPMAPPTADYADEDEATQAISLADVQAIDAGFGPPEPPPMAVAPEPAPKKKKTKAQPMREPAPMPEPEPMPETEPMPEPELVGEAEPVEPVDMSAWDEWNATVALVVEGVEAEGGDNLDWDMAQKIAVKVVKDAVRAGDLASDVEQAELVQDVVSEVVGVGPLADLLADEDVRQIVVNGPDVIRVWRRAGVEASGRIFASELSLDRIVDRLAVEAGLDPEFLPSTFEGTLPSGAALRIARYPVATQGALIVIRRPAVPRGFKELLSSGTLDKAAGRAILKAVSEGKNIIVTGPPGSGRTTLLGALAGVAPARTVVVSPGRELTLPIDDVAYLGRSEDAEELDELLGLRPERIIIDEIDARNIVGVVSLALSGVCPIFATARHQDPERLIRRMALQLELATGTSLGSRAKEMVGEVVDLIVCMAPPGSGKPLVSRVVEVRPERDSFALKVVAKR